MTPADIDALIARLRDLEYIQTNAVCPELRLEAAARIEALARENAELRKARTWQRERAERAEAECAALRKDAERYRWLRLQLVNFGCYDALEKVDEACDTGDAALAAKDALGEEMRRQPLAVMRYPSAARALVEQQALDEGLWFVAQTAPEAYLQAALRELHAAVEGETK